MEMIKLPRMKKEKIDQIIDENHLCRIAFSGGEIPYLAPFMYVFDGRFMYFLATRYGRKIEYVKKNSNVCVEVENYSDDFSEFAFATLCGRLIEVTDEDEEDRVRNMFMEMITLKKLSERVLSVFGYSPESSLEDLLSKDINLVWKLVDVKDIVALENQD